MNTHEPQWIKKIICTCLASCKQVWFRHACFVFFLMSTGHTHISEEPSALCGCMCEFMDIQLLKTLMYH